MTKIRENPESRAKVPLTRRSIAMRPLAASLPVVMKTALGRRGFGEGAIITDWPAIVGAEVAGLSAPERLSFPPGGRRAGVLQVRVAGPMAVELQHLEPLVLERINMHFGYQAVARIRITQGPLPMRPRQAPSPPLRPLNEGQEAQLSRCLSAVTEAPLREALERLGRALLSGVGQAARND
jgi:hypothetical protein